jgi:aspartate racemase
VKELGLLGGTTWLSTAEYYANLNRMVNERLGGHEFARCVLVSLNFGEVVRNVAADDLAANKRLVLAAAGRLKDTKVDALLLCANTLHLFAEEIEQETGLPIVHIASATAEEVARRGLRKVAILGTKLTMEQEFYCKRFHAREIETLIPEAADRDLIQNSIFGELAQGIFSAEMKEVYKRIIGRLADAGAEGAVFACTEIPLLLKPGDIPLPSFDTTEIHCRAAVDYMLA